MDMYNLRQIPSEAKIRKYLRVAVFGSSKLFCPECHHTNPLAYGRPVPLPSVLVQVQPAQPHVAQ